MKNGIIAILMIFTSGLVTGQQTTSEQITSSIKIPFTGNFKIDQYMADFQTLVTSAEMIVEYGGEEDKKDIGAKYAIFLKKYEGISNEIRILDSTLQKFVAGFINAKSTELTNLMKK